MSACVVFRLAARSASSRGAVSRCRVTSQLLTFLIITLLLRHALLAICLHMPHQLMFRVTEGWGQKDLSTLAQLITLLDEVELELNTILVDLETMDQQRHGKVKPGRVR